MWESKCITSFTLPSLLIYHLSQEALPSSSFVIVVVFTEHEQDSDPAWLKLIQNHFSAGREHQDMESLWQVTDSKV